MKSKTKPVVKYRQITIMNVLGAFHDYLADHKIKEIKLKKRIEKRFGTIGEKTHSISWIETFLQMPVPDYRKNAVSLIFAPYLINIRNCIMTVLH